MKHYQKLAKDWAEANSSPGIGGRTTEYEILISVQQQAYEAGFEKARDMCADRVQYSRFSIILRDDGVTRGYIKACEDIKGRVEQVGEEVK